MMHFTWVDYLLFGGYLLASVLVGLLFVKEQRTMKDFFLAGRSMGSVVVAISVLAALFSGVSYLGGPAEVFNNGTAFGFVLFSYILATPLTTIFILPFFYQSRFITAYHYLEERFSLQVRLFASGLFILRVLLWLGAATYAPALALQQATGLPLEFSILATGILTTLYTMMGGMKAVIWTDVMQFVVLAGGQVLIVWTAIGKIPGGVKEVWEVASTYGQPLPKATLDPSVNYSWASILIGGAVLNLVQMATDQVSVQRYMTARDLKTAQRGLWYKLAAVIPVIGLFYATGSVLRTYYNHAPDPVAAGTIKADQLLPWFVVHELPTGMAGVLIAAIFAASMSTISAGLNSLASATMVDFQQRLTRKELPKDDQQIFQARLWTLLYGILVIGLAFVVSGLQESLVESTNKFIGLAGGPILALFIAGIFIRHIGASPALWGAVFGFAISVFVNFPVFDKSQPTPPFLWITTIGCGSSLLVAWILSLIHPERPTPEQQKLTWAGQSEKTES